APCAQPPRRRRHRRVPDVPGDEPLEPAGRPPARPPAVGGDRQQHRRRRHHAPGLRLGPLRGAPDRHPLRRRAAHAGALERALRVRRRVRSRPVPDPREPAGRGRLGPPHPHGRARHLPAVRALCGRAPGRGMVRRQRGDLQPALEPDAPPRLDERRRSRPPDPPGPRPLRRGSARNDSARPAVHRATQPARVHLPGEALRVVAHRPVPAGDGPATSAQAQRPHQHSPPAVARRREGAAALRDAARRQRLGLVPQRSPAPALGQRRPPRPEAPSRQRLRGRRHVPAEASPL
ncbi:MAG: outermembrane protein, partial [uncultured Solirubrobacteraceae bacterium]